MFHACEREDGATEKHSDHVMLKSTKTNSTAMRERERERERARTARAQWPGPELGAAWHVPVRPERAARAHAEPGAGHAVWRSALLPKLGAANPLLFAAFRDKVEVGPASPVACSGHDVLTVAAEARILVYELAGDRYMSARVHRRQKHFAARFGGAQGL